MISVIVPVYNVEKYLPKCIESICGQTYRDLEIILVDDGSTDNCGKICEEYARKDDRIRVLHKQNGGLSDARNYGINEAKGEYIQFADSDDYLHPDMTRRLFQALIQNDADMAVCDFLPVKETDSPEFDTTAPGEVICFQKEQIMDQLQYRNTLTVIAWNKLYKTSVFSDLRYEKGRLHEDEYLIHHILHKIKKSVYLSDKLYFYVQHEGSITGKISTKRIEDGYEAYLERLDFMEKNHYDFMSLCTKKHILYFIFRHYGLLGKEAEDKKLKTRMKKDFKQYYHDPLMKHKIPVDLRGAYKLFVISPSLYYNIREILKWGKS